MGRPVFYRKPVNSRKVFSCEFFNAYVADKELQKGRLREKNLIIILSSKVFRRAVTRNRIRRWVRASYHLLSKSCADKLAGKLIIIVFHKNPIPRFELLTFHTIHEKMKTLFQNI